MRRASSWSLLALLLVPGLAAAQGQNHLYDKFQISGGGTFLIYSTTLRIDPEGGGEGTEIDAEEVLGLEKTNFQPRVAGRFRMGRRHELELGYQWADRSAEKILTQTIEIGDSTFDAGLQGQHEVQHQPGVPQLPLRVHGQGQHHDRCGARHWPHLS